MTDFGLARFSGERWFSGHEPASCLSQHLHRFPDRHAQGGQRLRGRSRPSRYAGRSRARRLLSTAGPPRTRPRNSLEGGSNLVRRGNSILIVDDTVLDKPYAHKLGLVGQFWSGKHQRVVRGINLVTFAWSDGDAVYPTDYRLVDPFEASKKTKNEHFREMLATAKGRGFAPRYVCFDAWYSSKENLKAVRTHGWYFLTQVRSNRNVNIDRTGNKPIGEQPIAATGTVVHVERFGLVKAFRIVAPNGDTEHWITVSVR